MTRTLDSVNNYVDVRSTDEMSITQPRAMDAFILLEVFWSQHQVLGIKVIASFAGSKLKKKTPDVGLDQQGYKPQSRL